jgi:Putative zinc-finger
MVVGCEEVWAEISNYLDGSVSPDMHTAMEEHIRGCKRCTAVLAGTRNVVELYGDERMVEAPLGYAGRLHRRLEANMPNSRRGFLGWMVAAAAGVLAAGGFEIARSTSTAGSEPRSEHAQPGNGIPPDLMVVISPNGKLFHVATCTFIHDKAHLQTMAARDAIRQGYVPCVRCMKQYLTQA